MTQNIERVSKLTPQGLQRLAEQLKELEQMKKEGGGIVEEEEEDIEVCSLARPTKSSKKREDKASD
jgi:hypothetical protein